MIDLTDILAHKVANSSVELLGDKCKGFAAHDDRVVGSMDSRRGKEEGGGHGCDNGQHCQRLEERESTVLATRAEIGEGLSLERESDWLE